MNPIAVKKMNEDAVSARSHTNRFNKPTTRKAAIRVGRIEKTHYRPLKSYLKHAKLSTVFEHTEIVNFEKKHELPSSSTDVPMDIPVDKRGLENLMEDLTVKNTMTQIEEENEDFQE